MTHQQYNKVLPFVWVCKFIHDINQNVEYRLTYRFSKEVPTSVPNPSMVWQKPSYYELCKINNRMMKEVKGNIYKNRSIFEKNIPKRR